MSKHQDYKLFPNIRNAEELGVAVLGSRHTAIVPPKNPIDRAEYGRKLAQAEDGFFTSRGYIVPKEGEIHDE
jgi:hypothetical protein